ncbi:MAG: hypothetical protein AABZ25_10805 [Nitrospirota bacterium]
MKKLILFIFLIISVSAYAEDKRYSVPIENSPSYGTSDAPVTIIEFLDFQ